MKKRELVTKILAGLLVAVMLIGLLPMLASAAESDTTPTATTDDHLHLNKTAVLQKDGTWTITLEAYATGKVERLVKTQVTPTDIILVLDQSGSMDNKDYYIDIGANTYSVVSSNDLPTNEEMVSGTYYYWDANDQKYYPITTTRHIVRENTYWAYSEDYGTHKAGDQVCLISDPNASSLVKTSWTYNYHTESFDSGKGYLNSDYRLYVREYSGSGNSRKYNYKLVQKGSAVQDALNTKAFEENVSGTNAAYRELVEKFPDYQTDTVSSWGSNYAFVYVPVEQVNADVYYYTYTYVDDMGQTWTIGHSEQDDGVGEVIANSRYDVTNLGNIYVENQTKGPRLTALKNAATSFINDIQAASVEHKVDHRIAVVGFAGNNGSGNEQDDFEYVNSELFIGANQYNYWSNASSYYDQAFQSANTTEGYNNLIASIGALEANGPTYASVGFLLAQGIAVKNANITDVTDENGNVTGTTNDYISGKRKLVVVFMTDGEPGWNGYESGENNLINVTDSDATINGTGGLAKELEDAFGATIYTVALLDKAPTNNGNVDNFLNNVTTDGIVGTGDNKYTLATDGVSLTNFFHTIDIEVNTTVETVELSENAFLVDRVSEYFNMPAGLLADSDNDGIPEGMKDYVSIFTAPYHGGQTFGEWNPVPYEISASADKEQTDTEVHAWVTMGQTDGLAHGITVHNFDYLATGNMVTTIDEVPSGRKLIVVIKGVTAKDGAALDYYIGTNNDHSGLWDLAESGTYGMLEAFPMPQTMLVNRVYVLDYAKDALLDTLDSTRKAIALDSAKDGIMNPVNTVHPNTRLTTSDDVLDAQGNTVKALQFGDAYIQNNKLRYTPKTTNWYGYDTLYVFWQAGNETDESGKIVWSEGDPNTGYGWSKVNVMPANNVYYEDTFVTTNNADTTAEGRVGINFGEGWSFVTENADGSKTENNTPVEGDNTEKPESAGQGETVGTHGWVESLADDTGFTDGTVAQNTYVVNPETGEPMMFQQDEKGSFIKDADGNFVECEKDQDGKYIGAGSYMPNPKATASFTFTGTGVDIYSYTSSDAGTVLVKVKPLDVREGYNVPTRYFIVDNYSASGNYYSIPTVSYTARGTDAEGNEALVYGKYEVTITVTAAAAIDGGRVTYYLDGIRVYNPLGSEQENNPTVGEGYGDEVHAFFYNIREYLIDENDFVANSENPGAVFIDEIKADQAEGETVGERVTTSVIGTYVDYGPKNEVYLAGDQMIVMKVDILAGRRYFVSLKSPTGSQTSAEISHTDSTKATVTVGHTADLYYEVVPTPDANDPSVGYIAIKNTGSELLSVTKFQITGLDPNPTDDENLGTGTESGTETAEILSISEEEAVTYARSFALMRSVPYTPSDNDNETGNDTTEQTPVEPEVPEIEITNPEVDPEPETPDEPSAEEQAVAIVKALVDRLFKSVRDWFNA